MRNAAAFSAFLLSALPALSQTGVVTEGNALSTAPATWLGEMPHFVIMGSVAGRALDVQFPDMAQATGVAEFAGKREYLPGDAGAYRYGDFEVALKAVIGGVERAIELEFENHDFASHSLPGSFALTEVEFPEGALSNLEVETEWEDANGSVNDEVAGWSGTLTLSLDSGTPDDKGLRADGMIGGHVVAEKGTDRLVISFTVPVAEYEIDD